jgi:hypothetical protein
MLWSKGTLHKLRMSGIPVRLCPWIGRIFGTYLDTHLSRNIFDKLWEEKIGLAHPSPSPDEAWDAILNNAGTREGRIDMRRLRSLLSRDRPPVEFVMDETQIPGPVIGTIHGSKGREAPEVQLMMPDDRYAANDRTPHAFAEEERVLYVGATRAKQTLKVGDSNIPYGRTLNGSGRFFRKTRNGNGLQVEFGRQRDFETTSVAGHLLDIESANELQEWLWERAVHHVPVRAEYSPHQSAYRLLTDSECEAERTVGAFSGGLKSDLWTLAGLIGKDRARQPRPSANIRYLHMMGSRTAVPNETARSNMMSPFRESGFVLAPVITGFTMVYY